MEDKTKKLEEMRNKFGFKFPLNKEETKDEDKSDASDSSDYEEKTESKIQKKALDRANKHQGKKTGKIIVEADTIQELDSDDEKKKRPETF